MAVFGHREPVAVSAPAISQDRIIASLESKGWRWFRDSDGDLGGQWDGRTIYFILRGERKEILQVQAGWNRRVSGQLSNQLLRACNEWSAHHLWPAPWVSPPSEPDGKVRVATQFVVDCEHGVTDATLNRWLNSQIAFALQFFDWLDDRFPDIAAIDLQN